MKNSDTDKTESCIGPDTGWVYSVLSFIYVNRQEINHFTILGNGQKLKKNP